jgi:hypothetical protein
MARRRKWPTTDKVLEEAKRGVLDGPTGDVPVLDLEDWELLGEPQPKETEPQPPPAPKRSAAKRSRRRAA